MVEYGTCKLYFTGARERSYLKRGLDGTIRRAIPPKNPTGRSSTSIPQFTSLTTQGGLGYILLTARREQHVKEGRVRHSNKKLIESFGGGTLQVEEGVRNTL